MPTFTLSLALIMFVAGMVYGWLFRIPFTCGRIVMWLILAVAAGVSCSSCNYICSASVYLLVFLAGVASERLKGWLDQRTARQAYEEVRMMKITKRGD